MVVVHRPSCSVVRGIFLDQGLNLCSPALAGRFFTTEPPVKPLHNVFLKNLGSLLSSLPFAPCPQIGLSWKGGRKVWILVKELVINAKYLISKIFK